MEIRKCTDTLPSGMVHTVESFGEPLMVFLFDITSTVSEQMRSFMVLEEHLQNEMTATDMFYDYYKPVELL